jgi:hypothetical protein
MDQSKEIGPDRHERHEVVSDTESPSSVPTLDEELAERTVIRKIDIHILPFVVLLYLFSFLDRGR